MDDESKHSVMRMQSKEDFFPSVQIACLSLLLTPMDLNFDTRYGNPWENGGILMQTYVPHWLPQCCEDCQVDRLTKRKDFTNQSRLDIDAAAYRSCAGITGSYRQTL